MSNKQKAVDALRKMNLTVGNKDHKKEPYKSDRNLADQLGVNSTTVNLARKNLILADECRIDIDKSIVYAWRWSGDDKYAKIGKCKKGSILWERVKMQPATYHPTDDIFLIGIKEYRYEKEISQEEKRILDTLGRTRRDREWVNINEDFNKMINEEFAKIEIIVK
ncbi:MAG: hypothetical protein OXU36_23455 [Candidatus Poribacteria bacterium]|nr:hypothetical protein [Candidatus Poribacteria bacterium]